jgi:hypothetical protein
MQGELDRRLAPRANAGIAVEDVDGGAPLTAHDVSLGGMMVTTTVPRWPGMLIHVRFSVPTEPRAIRATCRVVELQQADDGFIGLSLRFLKLAPAAQLAIHRFVDQRPLAGDEGSVLEQMRGTLARMIEDCNELKALSRP